MKKKYFIHVAHAFSGKEVAGVTETGNISAFMELLGSHGYAPVEAYREVEENDSSEMKLGNIFRKILGRKGR